MLSFISCSKTELIVVVEGPTNVFKDYPQSGNPNTDSVITILNKGETGEVIHTRYSKDFMFYKIRLKDGREGFVQFGDKFKVVPKAAGGR